MDAIVTTVVILVIAALALWIAFSPMKLPNTIRAMLKGGQARVADAIDDAVNRVEAAEADIDEQLAKANSGLIEIKTVRKALENQKAAAQAAVQKHQTQAENAASVGRKDLVAEAISRKHDAFVRLESIAPQLESVLGKETEVQNAVNALTKLKANMAKKKVEIKTRARTAKTTYEVNKLLAGVDLTGRNSNLDRAFDIVDEIEAKAGAMAEIANSATAPQRIDEELEALSRPQGDQNAEVDELMSKFSKAEEPR